ncbi:hypothetical protein [Pelagibaculum spongiae]|uniref:DUF304 domain-containing protein n=1 Tax=Pelagibaculum spongiae TaxID=2080658 RepID=A0A2V1GPN7_9GAMM|nr:hypothetical protein [Pelagibaculum spongiae]PVZ64539.1 hypothetical protein DC094_19705 [Pelagibaculum spongiae]
MDSEQYYQVAYDDETIIWQGGPSQWVNLGTFRWWGGCLVGAIMFLAMWTDHLSVGYGPMIRDAISWACYVLIFFSIISVLHAYLFVRYERIVITKNKIKEAKGITRIFRRELFCEISGIKDISSPPAGLLGLVGLSTLVIETNDNDQAEIKIRAIRDRDALIQKLLPVWRTLKMERKGYFGG